MTQQELMKQREAIRNHFATVEELERMRKFSGFRAALNDARLVTGRNMETGKIVASRPVTSIWLGSLCYMALLNQIGTCFKIKGAQDRFTDQNISEFTKALYRFTNLTPEEIKILYALRCSYAHDYALMNWDKRRRKYTYRFLVGVGSTGPMIEVRQSPVALHLQGRFTNDVARVNLELFGNLVEDVCSKLFALAETDDLEIDLGDKAEELSYRYSYWASK